jgi:hypothetical protein
MQGHKTYQAKGIPQYKEKTKKKEVKIDYTRERAEELE